MNMFQAFRVRIVQGVDRRRKRGHPAWNEASANKAEFGDHDRVRQLIHC